MTAFNEDNIIRKIVPNAVDLTTHDCKFDIRYVNAKYGNSLIRESVKKPINFKLTWFVPQYNGEFLLRFMIVDPKSPENIVTCKCKNKVKNILYSSELLDVEDSSLLPQDSTGIYPDERLSVLLPLRQKVSIYFTCFSECFLKAKKEPGWLIVVLENNIGKMFARRCFDFTIVRRPDRFKKKTSEQNNGSRITKPLKKKPKVNKAVLPEMVESSRNIIVN